MNQHPFGFNRLFALICSLMLGLAAGAVWMLCQLDSGLRLPWLAVPIGWLLGLAIRRWVFRPSPMAAILAALATLLAAFYLGMLNAAVQIAGSLGIGLLETLRTAGFTMLCALGRLALTGSALAWTLAGAALAAWTAQRGMRSMVTTRVSTIQRH